MSLDPKLPTIYVAGPITLGDQFRNVSKAFQVGQMLLEMGFAPFIPHATCLWHMLHENHYEEWLAYDFEWIKRCDAFFRMPGESSGADRERAWAEQLEKPIFETVQDAFDWAQKYHRDRGTTRP